MTDIKYVPVHIDPQWDLEFIAARSNHPAKSLRFPPKIDLDKLSKVARSNETTQLALFLAAGGSTKDTFPLFASNPNSKWQNDRSSGFNVDPSRSLSSVYKTEGKQDIPNDPSMDLIARIDEALFVKDKKIPDIDEKSNILTTEILHGALGKSILSNAALEPWRHYIATYDTKPSRSRGITRPFGIS